MSTCFSCLRNYLFMFTEVAREVDLATNVTNENKAVFRGA